MIVSVIPDIANSKNSVFYDESKTKVDTERKGWMKVMLQKAKVVNEEGEEIYVSGDYCCSNLVIFGSGGDYAAHYFGHGHILIDKIIL